MSIVVTSDKQLKPAMAEGLRVMVTMLPAYFPELPIHKGYRIVLLVQPEDRDRPEVMSNLHPHEVDELLEAYRRATLRSQAETFTRMPKVERPTSEPRKPGKRRKAKR